MGERADPPDLGSGAKSVRVQIPLLVLSQDLIFGKMAERLIAPLSKSGGDQKPPRVQIPFFPPVEISTLWYWLGMQYRHPTAIIPQVWIPLEDLADEWVGGVLKPQNRTPAAWLWLRLIVWCNPKEWQQEATGRLYKGLGIGLRINPGDNIWVWFETLETLEFWQEKASQELSLGA